MSLREVAATLACRAWERYARHRRPRPWTSAELAEYMRATERYTQREET